MKHKSRIAIIISHPIQHFCPQYASWAKNKNIELKVFFGSNLGLKKYTDPGFNEEISWGNLYMDEFDHEFLNGDITVKPDKHIDAVNLDSALSTFKPDLVIVYGYFQKLQRRAYSWAKRNNIRLAYISDSERRQRTNFVKEVLRYPFISYYFSKVDYFLTVGDANEDFYRYHRVKRNKFIRMHFPIDLIFYTKKLQEINQSKLREKFAITNNFVISSVGKIIEDKNHEHIILAMIELEKKGIYCDLLLAGSGDKPPHLKRLAEKLQHSKLQLLGFVSPQELPEVYCCSDIYIQPSLHDRHPLSVSEAIFCGLPIVISHYCGSWGETDDVQEGKNGHVYKFGHIHSLVLAIEMLFNNLSQRKKMGECSSTIALQFQENSHRLVVDRLVERISRSYAITK